MSTKITITTGTTTITVETDDAVKDVKIAETSLFDEKPDNDEYTETFEKSTDVYYPDSTFIDALYWLGEDNEAGSVEMRTTGGSTYYYNLTREQFDAWGTARSAGHWYHENLGFRAVSRALQRTGF